MMAWVVFCCGAAAVKHHQPTIIEIGSKHSCINIARRCSEIVKMGFGLYLDFLGYTTPLWQHILDRS
jgi:hypothetical protein